MKVTLLDHTHDPEQRVAKSAAICYDSDTSPEANQRRLKNLLKQRHMATMRFAYATFNISGISRVCSHQLVRIAHAGILQRSQRYVKESSVEYVIPPAIAALPPLALQRYGRLLRECSEMYEFLIDTVGIRKEDARYILPQSCTTELNLCLNFQAWGDVLRNRTSPKAQWEVREAMTEVQRQLTGIAPTIFGGSEPCKD